MRHPSPMTSPAPAAASGDGALGWARAWQQALYGPDGFYRRAAPAQHFATSAQGIPGGGALLAEAVAALAARYRCTAVVDVGAGRGELLTELATRAPRLALTGVDVVPRPPDLPPGVDGWLVSPGGPALPPTLGDLQDTLVLAHEWLDVVPCQVAQRDRHGVWREVEIIARSGTVTERPGPPLTGAEQEWAERWLAPQVWRAEIGLARERALTDLLTRVRSGLVVVVDYGHRGADRPPGGTLTGFRDGRQVDPVPDGASDLTAHVAVDALLATLPRGARAQRQGTVLRDLLGDPAPPVPHDLSRSDPGAYLRALARRGALGTLTSGALGDFWWVQVPVGDVR